MATHADWRKKMLEMGVAQAQGSIGCVQTLERIELRAKVLVQEEVKRERRHKEVIGMMRLMVLGVLGVLIVAIFATVGIVWGGETSFSGGYGGIYVWEGGNSFSGSGFPLGITYVPDRVEYTITKAGIVEQVVSSPLFFSTTQVIRDGDPDYNFTGVGYRLYDWKEAGVQIFLEGDVALKLVDTDTYKVGGYGGLRIPFEVNTQKFRFQIGGGWVDDPIFVFAINFATK